VITKSANWNLIVTGLKELKRSKKITDNIMKKIKELNLKNDKGTNK
tara:strand:+ start:357 stop:494 length:138 start_codon:yes stop_codon:yes gene_type:complete